MLLINKINFILFFILFFLQETQHYNLLILGLLIILALININLSKIKIPQIFNISLLFYFFYLIRGFFYAYQNPTIDIKFHVFMFVLFLIFFNSKNFNYLKLFFTLNVFVLLIYLLLFFKFIPNFWHEEYFGGFKGRLYGPSITAFIYIAFIYLYEKRKSDKNLVFSFLIALVYILLTTNFMNLIIIIILFGLILVDLKKIFNYKIIFTFLISIFAFILLIQSPFIPELSKKKLKYLSNPLEYPSLKMRVSDLKQAITKEKYTTLELFFGKGFGANTAIYRENNKAKSLSRTLVFQEIDNGFYYLFHRGGFSLLFLFLATSVFFILKIPTFNAKVAFFSILLITNLLSIHIYNYIFYIFIIYFIMSHPKSKRITF